MKYKPSKKDRDIIRSCAQRSAGMSRVKIEPGERFNVDDNSKPISLNFDLVSDDPEHSDTDLWETVDWSDFLKGVDLTDDGKGCFDFYVYSIGEYGQLETNVVAYYEKSKLVRVEGVGDGVMWSA